MAEKLVPLFKDGQPVELAMTPSDFFHKKSMPKGDEGAGELATAADAGYRLGDRYENLELYTGPKTQRQYDREQEERSAARAAETKPAEKETPSKDEKAK